MAKSVPAKEVENDYSKMTRKDFPEGFVFGTGTSAYQVEGAAARGGRGVSVWDDFSMRTPERISDGANGNHAVDLYRRYADDIRMMKKMGFDVYRFSISWTRIIPSGKLSLGSTEKESTTTMTLSTLSLLKVYNFSTYMYSLFKILIKIKHAGMEPHVTLFHWDLPDSLEKEYGGFLSPLIVNDYRDYVYVCFWEFGDRVKHWATFNEPWTYCYHGYVARVMPPGLKIRLEPLPAADANSSSAKIPVLRRGSIEDSPKPMHDYRIHEYIPPPTLTIPITPVMRTQGLAISDEPASGTSATKSFRTPKIISDPDSEPFIAAKNLIVAHAKAVDLYNRKFKDQHGGQIGIVLNNHCFEPLDDTKQEDIDAARRVHDFKFGWFLEPVLTGQYPETMRPYIPVEATFSDDEIQLLTKYKIDFVGQNYYSARYVKDYQDNDNDPNLYPFDKLQKASVSSNDKDGNPIGPCPGALWLFVVPWGIKKLLKKLNDYYNNSTYNFPALYITENGVAELVDPKLTAAQVVRDTTRVAYYRDHLGNILDVINEWKDLPAEEKLEIKGFFAWSWVDNYEWLSGYSQRFGIVYIDYMNNLKRYPKNSAVWFSQFLAGKIPQLISATGSLDEDDY